MWLHHVYFRHCHCDQLNNTTWSYRNCRIHSTETLKSVTTATALYHRIGVNIASLFYTIQTPICYVGCLMIANICTYISLYIRNTAIVENKKIVGIFPPQLVNTCDLHLVKSLPYHMVNCACVLRHFKQDNFPVEDLARTTINSEHQRFTLNITDLSCENAYNSR